MTVPHYRDTIGRKSPPKRLLSHCRARVIVGRWTARVIVNTDRHRANTYRSFLLSRRAWNRNFTVQWFCTGPIDNSTVTIAVIITKNYHDINNTDRVDRFLAVLRVKTTRHGFFFFLLLNYSKLFHQRPGHGNCNPPERRLVVYAKPINTSGRISETSAGCLTRQRLLLLTIVRCSTILITPPRLNFPAKRSIFAVKIPTWFARNGKVHWFFAPKKITLKINYYNAVDAARSEWFSDPERLCPRVEWVDGANESPIVKRYACVQGGYRVEIIEAFYKKKNLVKKI